MGVILPHKAVFFGWILSLLFQGQPAQGKIRACKRTALIPDLIITQCNVRVGFCRQGSISPDGHFQNFSLNQLARETKVEVLLRPYQIVDTAQYHVCWQHIRQLEPNCFCQHIRHTIYSHVSHLKERRYGPLTSGVCVSQHYRSILLAKPIKSKAQKERLKSECQMKQMLKFIF